VKLRLLLLVVLVVPAVPLALAVSACEPPPPDEPPPPPPEPLATPYEVTPAICDAGVVAVDGVGTCTLTVTNVTDDAVNVTGATSGPPFIAVGAAGTLEPGASLDVTVSALPRVVGVVEGELALGPGRLVVPLVVEGFALEGPLLDIVVSPDDVVAGDTVSIDAGLPADGHTFTWALAAIPAASAAELDDPSAAVVSFVADVAGEYTIQIVVSNDTGGTSSDEIVVSAREPRDLALTTTGGVLHFRPVAPVAEALCGPLDCFAGACDVTLGSGARQSPTAAGGGILVEDLPVGSFRVAVALAEGETAVSPTVSAFVQGALAGDATFALEPGDAHEAFDIVVSDDGVVTVVDVAETIVDGACG
jgi:hypothetical protein